MKRKLISSIAAISLAVASAVSLTSSASGTPRDPNGDGIVNMSDAIYIKQYLNGRVLPNNLTSLDFDVNGIISQMDSYKLQYWCLSLYSPPSRPSNETIVQSTGSTVEYRRHNYNSSNMMSYFPYSLNFNDSLYSLASTQSIIGDNDMVRDYDTAVVRLSTGGTGFIIGEHTIATAAHCVYNRTSSEFLNFNISVIGNDNSVVTTMNPHYVHIPKNYIYNTLGSDYALIYVDDNLSNYGKFYMGTALNDYVDRHGQVVVSGFPQEYPNGYTGDWGLRFKATGSVLSNSNSKVLYYDADTIGGDSGGPVYVEEDIYLNGEYKEYKTAIAIHTNGGNYGTRINENILRFFYYNNHLTN